MGFSSCASGRTHVAMVPRWNCTTLLLAAVLTHFAPSVGADVPTLMQSISSEMKAIHRVDAAAATSTGGARKAREETMRALLIKLHARSSAQLATMSAKDVADTLKVEFVKHGADPKIDMWHPSADLAHLHQQHIPRTAPRAWRSSNVKTDVLPYNPDVHNPGSDRIQWSHCERSVCVLRYCAPPRWSEKNLKVFTTRDFPAKSKSAHAFCLALGGRLPTTVEVKSGMFIDAEDLRHTGTQLPMTCSWSLHSEAEYKGTKMDRGTSIPVQGATCANGGLPTARVSDGSAGPCTHSLIDAAMRAICVTDVERLCVCLSKCEYRKTTVFDPMRWCETLPGCPTATKADGEHGETGKGHAELVKGSKVGPWGAGTTAADGAGRTAWIHCDAPLFSYPKSGGSRDSIRSWAKRGGQPTTKVHDDYHPVRRHASSSGPSPAIMREAGILRGPTSRGEFAKRPRSKPPHGKGLRHYLYVAPSPPDGLGTDFNWIKFAFLAAVRLGSKVVFADAQMMSENSPQYLSGKTILTPFGTLPSDLFNPFGLGDFAPADPNVNAAKMFEMISNGELQVRYVQETYGPWDLRNGWWEYADSQDPTGDTTVDALREAYDDFDRNPRGRGREGAVVLKTMPSAFFHFPYEFSEWLRYAYTETRSLLRPKMPLALMQMTQQKRAVVVAIRLGDLLLPQYAGHTSRLMSIDFFVNALTTLFVRSAVAEKLPDPAKARKALTDSSSLGCATAQIIVITQLPPLRGSALMESRRKVDTFLQPLTRRFGHSCVTVALCSSVAECESEQSASGNQRALLRDLDTLTRADVFLGSRSSSISRLAAALAPAATIKLLPFEDLEMGPPTLEGIDRVLEVCLEHDPEASVRSAFDLNAFDRLWHDRYETRTHHDMERTVIRDGKPTHWPFYATMAPPLETLPTFSRCAPHCRLVRHVGTQMSVVCSSLDPLAAYEIYLVDKTARKKRLGEVRTMLRVSDEQRKLRGNQVNRENDALRKLKEGLEKVELEVDHRQWETTEALNVIDIDSARKFMRKPRTQAKSHAALHRLDAKTRGSAIVLSAKVPVRPDPRSKVETVAAPCGSDCGVDAVMAHWICAPEQWEPSPGLIREWPSLKHYVGAAGWSCAGAIPAEVLNEAKKTGARPDVLAPRYSVVAIVVGRIDARAYAASGWPEVTQKDKYLRQDWLPPQPHGHTLSVEAGMGETSSPPMLHSVTSHIEDLSLVCHGSGVVGGKARDGSLVCCPAECGPICGSIDCAKRPGAFWDGKNSDLSAKEACCVPSIVARKHSCDDWAPPCSLSLRYPKEYFGVL